MVLQEPGPVPGTQRGLSKREPCRTEGHEDEASVVLDGGLVGIGKSGLWTFPSCPERSFSPVSTPTCESAIGSVG